MGFNVNFDWKFLVALFGGISSVILVKKITPDAAERVLIHAIDTAKGFALAGNSER